MQQVKAIKGLDAIFLSCMQPIFVAIGWLLLFALYICSLGFIHNPLFEKLS